VSSGLLLQRVAGRTRRQPRTVVVSERRVPHAEAADSPDRVSPRARRRVDSGGSWSRKRLEAGAAGAARRSGFAERGARRGSVVARERRAAGEVAAAAPERSEADRVETG